MSDFTIQLQRAVDEYREHCKKALPTGLAFVNVPGLKHTLEIDVIPDGMSWIVTIKCGDRYAMKNYSVDPQSFLDNLYTNVVALIRFFRQPEVKLS